MTVSTQPHHSLQGFSYLRRKPPAALDFRQADFENPHPTLPLHLGAVGFNPDAQINLLQPAAPPLGAGQTIGWFAFHTCVVLQAPLFALEGLGLELSRSDAGYPSGPRKVPPLRRPRPLPEHRRTAIGVNYGTAASGIHHPIQSPSRRTWIPPEVRFMKLTRPLWRHWSMHMRGWKK